MLSASVAAQNIYDEYKWEDRDKWQQPEKIIKHLALNKGDAVADIGSHQGYMSVKLSKVVGKEGKVFAVDVDQYQLTRLEENMTKRDISNVTTTVSESDDPKLPSNTLNAVLILDTYHEIDAYEVVLKKLHLALKTGGRLVISDPVANDRRGKARDDQTAKHELGMDFAIQEVKAAGFSVLFTKDPYIDRTAPKGDKLWIVVAEKKG